MEYLCSIKFLSYLINFFEYLTEKIHSSHPHTHGPACFLNPFYFFRYKIWFIDVSLQLLTIFEALHFLYPILKAF